MENKFLEVMSMRTDAELENIANAPAGDSQQEAVEAAKQEIETRQLLKDKFSSYSTNELEYCLRRPDTREFQVATEEIKARRIPTHPKYEIGISPNKAKSSDHKYPALESITRIFQVVAVLLGAVAAIGALLLFAEISRISGLLALVGGGVLVLGLIAIKELIKLFIDIEYNTRNSNR